MVISEAKDGQRGIASAAAIYDGSDSGGISSRGFNLSVTIRNSMIERMHYCSDRFPWLMSLRHKKLTELGKYGHGLTK